MYVQYETNREDTTVTRAGLVCFLVIPGDPIFFGIPLFKALIGATLFAALWYLLTYRIWHHRNPYYQRRVPA